MIVVRYSVTFEPLDRFSNFKKVNWSEFNFKMNWKEIMSINIKGMAGERNDRLPYFQLPKMESNSP